MSKLTAETIASLNEGLFGAAVDKHITDILKDCEDRPGLKAPRTIKIELKFLPVMDQNGRALSGVEITPKASVTVPAQLARTEYLQTKVDAKGNLDANLPSSYQDTIFDAERKLS